MKKIKTLPHIPGELDIVRTGTNGAKISIYPFEAGYAVTLAHPIKRLLLSSSVGFAPTGIKIEGARHEFDSIRGMLEDVAELIINLKNLRFTIKDDAKRVVLNYSFNGSKEIKGADLGNDQIVVHPADGHLATLNDDGVLNFSLIIEKGMGYVPSEDIRSTLEEGYLPLDAFFMPIKRGNYTIERMLVEDNPNYEKVVFDVLTDGDADPVELFKETISGMYKQMAIFNRAFGIESAVEAPSEESDAEIKKLFVSVDDLNLSARSHNSLIRSNIKYLGDLVLMNEKELAEIKNLGKKSLDEIKAKLEECGYPVGSELAESVMNALKQKLQQLKG